MAKKSRLKDDAFSWVQDTSKKAEPQSPVERVPAEPEKPAIAVTENAPRSLLVKYDKSSGHILALQEIKTGGNAATVSWPEVTAGQAVIALDLSGDLTEKELVEIHKNCRIELSGKKPRLVFKS